MRVLHVLASTGWGGAERVACTLHRLALTHGHLSALEGPALPELVARVADETGETLPAGTYERALAVWMVGARRRRTRFAPDVVHVHLATPSFGAASWFIAGRVPAVFTFHLLPLTVRWPNDRLMPVGSPRVLAEFARRRRRHAFVATTSADGARLNDVVPGSDVAVVASAPPLGPVRAGESKPLSFLPGVLQLLSVGRLHEQKGFDRLVTALADPRVRELPWHWTIVGDGDARPGLEASVASHGLRSRVTFTGFLSAERLFEQADLVLVPSRFEGTSLVPIEALLARKPVLASKILPHVETLGAVPESLLPEDDAEWAATLARVLSDAAVREELRTAQGHLTPSEPRERLWLDYERVYQRVLAR